VEYLKTEMETMTHAEFWGPSIDAEYARKFKEYLDSFTPISFTSTGDSKQEEGFPPAVKFMPHLLSIAHPRHQQSILQVYESAVKDGGKGILNWAHGKEHAPFVQKMLVKVRTQTHTHTHTQTPTHTHTYIHTHTLFFFIFFLLV
jgi:hypothetical protein